MAALIVGSTLIFMAGGAGAAAPPPRDIADACPSGIETGQFRDVSTSNVHARAIDCIVAYGITTGTSPGRYSPATSVSRAQIASFLARLVERTGGSLPSNAPDAFDDDDGSIHESNTNRLAAAGVIGGTGPRKFSPSQPITRDQMATLMARIYQLRAGQPLPPTADDYFIDDEGNSHEDNINRLAANGIVGGKTATTYDPSGSVPRDAMASFMARQLDKLVEDGIVDPPSRQVYLGRCNDEGLGALESERFHCGQKAIDGTPYLRAIYSSWCGRSSCYDSQFAEFDLGRDFKTLTATIGISDDSQSTATALVEVFVDNTLKYSQQLQFGQAYPMSVDVTDGLRLKILVTRPDGTGDGYAVFGEPRVEG